MPAPTTQSPDDPIIQGIHVRHSVTAHEQQCLARDGSRADLLAWAPNIRNADARFANAQDSTFVTATLKVVAQDLSVETNGA